MDARGINANKAEWYSAAKDKTKGSEGGLAAFLSAKKPPKGTTGMQCRGKNILRWMASGGKKEGPQILFGIKDEVMPASDAGEKKKKSGAYAPNQERNPIGKTT